MGDQGNRGAAIDRLLRRALEAGAGAQPGVCPDPDVIAAYLEGGLSGHEREEFERHAASCERCLATLAAVAEIGPLPGTGEAPERARPWWRGVWPWLAPLTAAATAAVVYVAVRPVPLPGPASTAPVVTERLAEADAPAAGREDRLISVKSQNNLQRRPPRRPR